MPNKTVKKSKALKNRPKNGMGFFGALLFSLLICVSVWILLALIVSLALSGMSDSTFALSAASPVIAGVSLVSGGFAAGKLNRENAVFTSLILGCTVLGTCYGLSIVFNLSGNHGVVVKILIIASMLVLPLVGTVLSLPKDTKKSHRRKRM